MTRILISADMEGVAGITHGKQCMRGADEFPESCRLMTAEVVAACEGAFNGGATEIVVNDSHSDMRNIDHEALPKSVRLLRGNTKPWSMMQGIDETFNAIAFVGYHAAANSVAGILDHTYSGTVVHNLLLNGEPCSEARLNSAVAGAFGVPAIFLSGDQTACADASRFLPWIHTAEVKHAVGRTAALSLSPLQARERIATTIETAVHGISSGSYKPYLINPSVTLDVTLRHAEMADNVALLPEIERIDGTTVRIVHPDIRTVYRYFRVALILANAVA